MFSKTLIAAAAAALFTTANAHFFISTPSPIPGSADKSPLDPSGSNFPCQGADISQGPVTNMAAGSNQPLQFNLGGGANTAVHGGGSCQIALTYETDKTKLKDPSSWKVIHSFVGGCPTNAAGNLDAGAIACTGSDSTNCVNQNFTFTIPPEAKSGSATLGWTWFNNIGNREMYMNCARVSITGANGNLAGLPNLFTANIGSDCKTTEKTNVDFPNPGKYVTKDPKLNYQLMAPVGSACGSGAGSAASSSSGSGSSGSSSSGSGSSGSGSGSSASSAPSSSPSSTKGGKGGNGGSNGGAFAEGSSPTSAPTAAAAAAPSTAATAAPATPASSGSTSGSGSGSCTGSAVACSASGFYCIDANHFGECAFGCAVPMQMAAGTTCANNAVAHAVARKRHWNFFNRLF